MSQASDSQAGYVRVGNPVVESPDDIVISGVGIRCSQSENIEEFAENLYNGVNMVHENLERCDEDHFGVPKQHGFIKDIRKFDATFFGVHPKQAEGMDPQLRILHEVAYESIIDAGVDPASLKNSNTGVFIGTSNSDAREAWTSADVSEIDGYSLIGTHRAFLANRLSFTFDLRGPSFGVDAACATSGIAINQGYLHIKNKVCDAALVGGVSLVYQPKVSYQILKLGLLCKDGKCKVFDEAADGYVRAEGIVSIFLQRRKDANRVFATLVHSKTNNDGFKEQGITFPSTESQGQLISEVYAEAGIDPEDVEYVEAHGTGTTIGDPQETNGIALGFANTRTKPLPIGAVKSNMGHSEHASGAVSVCKIIIAMQTGIIPPNLHYKTPNPLIPGLVDGRLKVVTEPMKWNSTVCGLNCFGFGGQNSHLVLRGNPKVRDVKIDDPRLVIYMGRTEEAATHAMNYVQRYPDNPYVPYLLMQSAHAKPASMPFRGYTITNTKDPVLVVERVSTEQKPVWLVFSGQGTQWASMGREILKLNSFRSSIEKCAEALKPTGLDLFKLLSDSTDADYEDPTISFVGIAAIQVALVDLLRAMKIEAQGFVGHSAGEIGCAYADGSFSAEEAILAAYWRGRAVKEAKLPAGAMAAVGLSWQEAQKKCKGNVHPACNNAKDNVTISGPLDEVTKLVEELKSQNIFAKEVNSYGVAFHSPAMKQAAPAYLNALKKVLVSPKMRTTRWLSTAVDERDWNTELAKYASAEYFAHNLTSTVKFHEALSKVPSNAVVIEVAPHGLLQALIKATVGGQATPVALMKKGHANNLNFFLEAVGKLYLAGLNPHVNEIFPKPQLPAPRDTPFLGPVVRWDHSASWRIPKFTDFIHKGGKGGSQHSYTFDLSDPLNARLLDNKIGTQALFSIGGLLSMAGKAFAAETGNTIEKSPRLHFSNVRFHKTVPVEGDKLQFDVNVTKSTGYFEIHHHGESVVSGYVDTASPASLSLSDDGEAHSSSQETQSIKNEDIYQEFHQRGYNFGPNFQLLKSATDKATVGKISSTAGYDAAIDGLLQLLCLSQSSRDLVCPTEIQSLVIDIPKVSSALQSGVVGTVHPELNIVSCVGAEIEGVKFTQAPEVLTPKHQYSLKEYGFVANNGQGPSKPSEAAELKQYMDVITGYLFSKANELIKNGLQSTTLSNLINNKDINKLTRLDQNAYAYFCTEPNATLLHLLQKTFEVLESKFSGSADDVIRKTVASLRPTLKDDLLLNALTKRNVVQPVIDVVIENTTDDVIQILELLRGDQPSKGANIVTDLQTPSSVALEFKSLTLKAGQQTEIRPASATLLVTDNYFIHDVNALSGDLKTVSTILKDDGYLLVVQPFSGHANELGTFTAFNDQKTSTSVTLPTLAEFKQHLTAEGFQVVLEKTDGVLNHLLLCRKVFSEPVTKHVVVKLTEGPTFTVEQHAQSVKQSLTKALENVDADAAATMRVWLVAPKGRTDLAQILALPDFTEHPQLRFVVDNSRQGTGLPAFDVKNPSYASVIASDLKYNVYDGKDWGTIRNIPFSQDSSVDTMTAVAYHSADGGSLSWYEGSVENASSDKETVAVYYATVSGSSQKLVAFAGYTVPRGEPVIGTVPSVQLATHVAVKSEDLVQLPKTLSLKDAATLPFPYSVAYYALNSLAQAKKGQSVLVHVDGSAQSEAVLRTAVILGLDVYAVGADQTLATRIPQLKNRIFSSLYDKTAANQVLQSTSGRGVNIVVNTTNSNRLQQSSRVLATNGAYIQVGKSQENGQTGKQVAIYNNVAETVARLDDSRKLEINKFLSQAISRGELVALAMPSLNSLKELSSANLEGNVLLTVRTEYPITPLKASRRVFFRPEKTYVVIGPDAELLASVAHWLATRGARLIQLSGPSDVERVIKSQQRFFKKQGADVKVSSPSSSAETLLQAALSRAPIGGIFVLDHLRYKKTTASSPAKLQASSVSVADLDRASRTLCKDTLDYFVVLSSAKDSSAETVETRVAAGLPGQVVDMGNLVAVATDDHQAPEGQDQDGPALPVMAGLDALNQALRQSSPILIISPPPRTQKHRSQSSDDDGSGPQDKSHLPQTVAKIMGIKDFAALDMFLSLGDYGIDSLMAMELGKILERDFNLSLTLGEIRSLCVRDICLMSGATNAVEAAKFSENKTLSETPTLLDNVKKHYNFAELVPKQAVVALRQVKERNEIMFIVHPMEGSVLPVLESLANHLQITTYGLNCTADSDLTSMETLAKSYIKAMRSVQPHGPYNVAGYSFGAGVAFEMALQLQKEDAKNVSNLILLDGSHSFVGAFTKTMKSGYTVDPNMPLEEMNRRKQNAFEDAIFVLYVTQLVKTQRKQLTDKLAAAKSFEERVEVAAQELHRCPDLAAIPLETLRAAAISFAHRLMVADTYKPAGKYNGPLTLIKCTEKMIRNLGEYYELDKVSTKKDAIRAHTVPGNHEGFVLGESARLTANHINQAVLSP